MTLYIHVYSQRIFYSKYSEYGIYGTIIRQFTPGQLECKIRRKNNQIKPIATNGGDPLVKYIFSPGSELAVPEEYV